MIQKFKIKSRRLRPPSNHKLADIKFFHDRKKTQYELNYDIVMKEINIIWTYYYTSNE